MEALEGRAYDALRDLIYEVENTELAARMQARQEASRRGSSPPTGSSFVFFKDVMKKIQACDGDGGADWVLRDA